MSFDSYVYISNTPQTPSGIAPFIKRRCLYSPRRSNSVSSIPVRRLYDIYEQEGTQIWFSSSHLSILSALSIHKLYPHPYTSSLPLWSHHFHITTYTVNPSYAQWSLTTYSRDIILHWLFTTLCFTSFSQYPSRPSVSAQYRMENQAFTFNLLLNYPYIFHSHMFPLPTTFRNTHWWARGASSFRHVSQAFIPHQLHFFPPFPSRQPWTRKPQPHPHPPFP